MKSVNELQLVTERFGKEAEDNVIWEDVGWVWGAVKCFEEQFVSQAKRFEQKGQPDQTNDD